MRALTRDEYRMLVGDDVCSRERCTRVGGFYTFEQARRIILEGLIELEDCPHNDGLAHGKTTALGRTAVLCYEALHLKLTA